MKNLTFIKIRSRLGVRTMPWKQDESNVGVENAPDFVLSEDFLKNYPDHKTLEYDFPKPEYVDEKDYKRVLLENYTKLDEILEQKIGDSTPVFVGGDHSIAFSSLLWLVKNKNPETTGYVQFDTHPDLNNFASTKTRNFHGIWARPFFDKIDYPEMEKLIPKKLRPENAVWIGNFDIEDTEKDFFLGSGFSRYQEDSLDKAAEKLEEFVQKFKHIHVSFDMDVFNKKLVSATTCIAPNGLNKAEVFPLLEILRKAKSLSFDLVEIIPRRDVDGSVVKLGQEVLRRVLSGL